MGTPMVKNLIKAGFEVTVYNRTPAKAAPLQEAGAAIAASPAALWARADTVITMVSDDAALRQIHQGETGLLAGTGSADGSTSVGSGKTVIDMSTVSPATSRDLAAQLAAKGVEYLDAPVARDLFEKHFLLRHGRTSPPHYLTMLWASPDLDVMNFTEWRGWRR